MSEVDKNLAEILNTDYVPMVKEDKPIVIHQEEQQSEQILSDADYARSNLYGLIEKGNEQIESMANDIMILNSRG